MSTFRRSSSGSKWNNSRRWSISSSSIDLIGVVYWSITDSELNYTGNSEGWTSTSPLSMAWWLSLPMKAGTVGLVLGVGVLDLKWSAGGWLFRSLGCSFSYSPPGALNLFIFLLRLGGRNSGPRIMQESVLCPILPHNYQILFYLMCRSVSTG